MSENDYEAEIEKSCCGILHWNYRNLVEIPEDLRKHGKHIENIYLKGNSIFRIPKWIPQLENLTELYLYDNCLSEIPEEISLMKSLTVLDVGRNKINQLPKTFTSLSSLYFFSANDNLIQCLPKDIGKLKSLQFIYLSRNSLKYLPESISSCNSLQEISLDYNNLISIPKSIIYLPNLSYLSLQGNYLKYLPAIPLYSKPMILLWNNDFLKYISYDFAKYLQACHAPPGWNFKSKKYQGNTEKKSNEILVRSKDGNQLIMPFTAVYQENFCQPVPLYELCLRKVYSLFYEIVNSCRLRLDLDQLQLLPKTIQNEIILGPTSACQNCKNYLFRYAWIRIFEIQALDATNEEQLVEIIEYFCSVSCSKAFRDENNNGLSLDSHLKLHEIEWNYV